jgi:hypothetical protein
MILPDWSVAGGPIDSIEATTRSGGDGVGVMVSVGKGVNVLVGAGVKVLVGAGVKVFEA